jgi:hypothetical protein
MESTGSADGFTRRGLGGSGGGLDGRTRKRVLAMGSVCS